MQTCSHICMCVSVCMYILYIESLIDWDEFKQRPLHTCANRKLSQKFVGKNLFKFETAKNTQIIFSQFHFCNILLYTHVSLYIISCFCKIKTFFFFTKFWKIFANCFSWHFFSEFITINLNKWFIYLFNTAMSLRLTARKQE